MIPEGNLKRLRKIFPEGIPECLLSEPTYDLLPRDRLPICDYHGLTVEEALVRFVSDYSDALHLPQDSQQFRVVHGYGSTGRGGRIRTNLREMLTFEMEVGVLTFRESEYLDTHPGYTIVSPISDLHRISARIFSSPISSRQTDHVVRRINASIECHMKPAAPKTFPAIDPNSLDALNHVFDQKADDNRSV